MEKNFYEPGQKTKTAKVWIEDGILRVIYLEKAEITVEVKKEHHRLYSELAPFGPLPMLLEIREGVNVTREARSFSKKIEDKQPFSACAVVVDNLGYRILANFYMRFYRPKKPFRVFDNIEAAKNWLQQFKT
ncbi:MAG: hypothetical protein ACOZCO_14480 [Bacteroidota bacterium]